jgi:SAM-dependent methyltransferase
MRILDVGCGKGKKHPEAIGIDFTPESDAEYIHDLNECPWPLPDNEFDKVFMISVLEHLDNVHRTMGEVHRVSKPGAKVVVFGPTRFSNALYDDPEHKRALTLRSLDFCIDGSENYRHQNSIVKYKVIRKEYQMGWLSENKSIYNRILLWFANTHTAFYTSHLECIFPVQRAYFELEVMK